MPHAKITLVLWFAIATLTGCQLVDTPKNYPAQAPLQFTLHQDLTFAPGTVRFVFQEGEGYNGSAINHWREHCRIELRYLADVPQTLPAGRYSIERIQFGTELIAQTAQPGLVNWLKTSDGDADHATPIMELVHFYSADPNAFYRLTCASALSDGSTADYPYFMRPSPTRIAEILGDWARLD